MKSLQVILLVFIVFAASNANATVARYMALSDLWKASDVVVDGAVVEQWTEAPDGLPGLIYTHTLIEVKTSLKGHADNYIELKQVGGTIGKHRLSLSGTPLFQNGEQIVVFASLHDDELVYSSVGLAQGVFYHRNTPDGDRLVRNLAGIGFYGDPIRQFVPLEMPQTFGHLIDELFTATDGDGGKR